MGGSLPLAAVLLALPSVAAADDLAAFEACVGVEKEDRARALRDAAPCRAIGDCGSGSDDLRGYSYEVELACAAAQVDRCAGDGDPTACFGAFAADLNGRRVQIVAALPPDRIDNAIAADGFLGRSVERNRGRLFLSPEVDICPIGADADAALGLPGGTLCGTYETMNAWLNAEMCLRMVERAEAD